MGEKAWRMVKTIAKPRDRIKPVRPNLDHFPARGTAWHPSAGGNMLRKELFRFGRSDLSNRTIIVGAEVIAPKEENRAGLGGNIFTILNLTTVKAYIHASGYNLDPARSVPLRKQTHICSALSAIHTILLPFRKAPHPGWDCTSVEPHLLQT